MHLLRSLPTVVKKEDEDEEGDEEEEEAEAETEGETTFLNK